MAALQVILSLGLWQRPERAHDTALAVQHQQQHFNGPMRGARGLRRDRTHEAGLALVLDARHAVAAHQQNTGSHSYVTAVDLGAAPGEAKQASGPGHT